MFGVCLYIIQLGTSVDVLGCTRATLIQSTSLQPWPIGLGNLVKLNRDGDRPL